MIDNIRKVYNLLKYYNNFWTLVYIAALAKLSNSIQPGQCIILPALPIIIGQYYNDPGNVNIVRKSFLPVTYIIIHRLVF